MKITMISIYNEIGGIRTHTLEVIKNMEKYGINIDKVDISLPLECTTKKSICLWRRFNSRIVNVTKNLIKRNFDIAHLQAAGFKGGLLTMVYFVFICKVLKCKSIITYHYDTRKMLKIINNFLGYITFNIILKNIDAFLVVSNSAKKELLKKFGLDFNKKIFIISNGFDPQKFRPIDKKEARKKLKLNPHKKIIFTLGVLEEYKGHKYLIRSIEYIIKKRRDIICYIGGIGPLYNSLNSMIEKRNLSNYIKLLGYISDEDLIYWINAADIFVLPSLNESFGIAQIEAMACGKPIVATINGGSEEIIISEDYGFLCPPKDSKCLSHKILLALEKDWDEGKIIKYAYKFTWENVAKEYIRIYQKIA